MLVRLMLIVAVLAPVLAASPAGAGAMHMDQGEHVCESGSPEEGWLCPEPGEPAAAYIVSLYSDAATNGLAVTFTEEGMEQAMSCDGAGELATLVAALFSQLPPEVRAEDSIEWAIPRMTGEIRGHALIYRAALRDSTRERANPVNIVFPEYGGDFPGGLAGLSSRAQHLYYATLCS